jgi:hypothetical protein
MAIAHSSVSIAAVHIAIHTGRNPLIPINARGTWGGLKSRNDNVSLAAYWPSSERKSFPTWKCEYAYVSHAPISM